MNQTKLFVGLTITTLFILFAGVYFFNTTNPSTITMSANTKVSVDQKTHNWGKIPYSGGNINKTFTIKNIGTDTVKLNNIKTSCTCTKARITIDGKDSPYFSMHAASSWVGEIPSGKEATLTVIYDPAFHGPSGVGPIERLISVETNDKNNPKLEFSLKGVVVK